MFYLIGIKENLAINHSSLQLKKNKIDVSNDVDPSSLLDFAAISRHSSNDTLTTNIRCSTVFHNVILPSKLPTWDSNPCPRLETKIWKLTRLIRG